MSSKPATPVNPLAICQWLALPSEDLLRECKQARFQGSGPGGQKRNRVYSGIRLSHLGSGLAIEADARRESRGNLEDALHRLRLQLALSIAAFPGAESKVEAATIVGAKTEAKIIEATLAFHVPPFRTKCSASHQNFPLFAMRAIYWLEKFKGQTASAAQALGCTASALTRFLKVDKALWVKAREIREEHGLHALK